MKEYLLKTEYGTYHYHNDSHDKCPKYVEKIEIPSHDCDCAVLDCLSGVVFNSARDGIHYLKSLPTFLRVLWQRAKQPEELPFVDDFPDFLFEDTVNHPSHYASGEIECIDAIESSMTHEAFCGYLKGNVQKYMWRYENKGGLESLEKAQWYLNKLISRIG